MSVYETTLFLFLEMASLSLFILLALTVLVADTKVYGGNCGSLTPNCLGVSREGGGS